jgi:hypothetical protein
MVADMKKLVLDVDQYRRPQSLILFVQEFSEATLALVSKTR